MSTNTKALLIALGVPTLGGMVAAAPGALIAAQGDQGDATKAIGLGLAIVGGFFGAFYVAKAIIK